MTDEESTPHYGLTDDEIAARDTVYEDGLCKGKVVLVSGAGSGIGKAIAALYARLGAKLVICGRNEEKLKDAEDFFRGLTDDVSSHVMSIRDPDAVAAMMDAVWAQYGRLDVLINNAGGQFAQDPIDYSPKGWNAVIDTNLNGTWFMMQSAARHWRDHKQPGSIVNITAMIHRTLPGLAHTVAARAAVTYLSKSVAVEWAPLDIRVNCVAVGSVESTGFGTYTEEGRLSFYQSNPMKRPGTTWDVAEACVYLTSQSGNFITGEELGIDGGQKMWGDMWAAGKPDYFKLEK